MKKITDFLVNKRNYVLVLFIILTFGCFLLSNKVKINRDMAEYLPKSSETSQGMDIMDQEFGEIETSTLNLMFKDLNNKDEVLNYLNNLKGIKEVEYEDTEEYNKDNYTLFVITVDSKADSKISDDIYHKITNKYQDYEIFTSGDVASENKDVLPIWIVALAIVCGLIILIIMCDSYTEPFLFLFAILLSVVMNKGTNIIFGTISSITSAIAAILQLALSMDYSIMLMNRYRQEKINTTDDVEAMKKALYASFKAISSSSLTTIVGLLALVFMSFTIGRDLGFVLAKGVLFSLLAVFTCLPALILMFDKLINKTKKKSINPKLNALGAFAYKARFLGIFAFFLIFTVCVIYKNKLNITYSDMEYDEVAKVFDVNNEMAVIYPTKEEDKIKDICENLEKNDKVKEVLCYSNTLNEPLVYDKLNERLKDFGEEKDIEEYLLKLVFYHYYNQKEDNKINLNDLLNFIEKDVYNNENLNKNITKDIKNNITKLSNFTDFSKMKTKRTSKDMANMFDIPESKVNDLLIYYNSSNISKKITLEDFIAFLNSYVLKSSYASNISRSSKDQITYLTKFLNETTLNTKIDSNNMASLFGLKKEDTQNLYLYYLQNTELPSITINELATFIINDILPNPNYQNYFKPEMITKLNLMQKFSSLELIKTKLNSQAMSELLGQNELVINAAYGLMGVSEASPYELVSFLLTNEELKPLINDLNTLYFIMDNTLKDTKFNYIEASTNFNIEENLSKNIYTLYLEKTSNLTLSPLEFITFLLEHQNDEALQAIDKEIFNSLNTLNDLIKAYLNKNQYSYQAMSKVLNIDSSKTKLLYSLYEVKKENKNVKLSYYDFVAFLLDNCVNNSEYAKNFEEEQILKLKTVSTIMKDSLNKQKYTKEELITKIDALVNDFDHDLVDLIYLDYGSVKTYQETYTMTIEEFITYLNKNILQDQRFDDYISKDLREDIISGQDKVKEAKDLLRTKKYSRMVMETKYPVESKETFSFIKEMQTKLKNTDSYMIGNSLVSFDISESFQNELNLITILTIAFIFVVVMITFKSVLIPGILVFLIQTAVYMTMSILTLEGGSVYFIALLIVQSILMGATIDYAILYTTYYLEARKQMTVKESLISAYNKSIHTILTSSLILMLVTLVVGHFGSAITAKICITISQGTLCSTLLILFILPELIAIFDRLINKKKKIAKNG